MTIFKPLYRPACCTHMVKCVNVDHAAVFFLHMMIL